MSDEPEAEADVEAETEESSAPEIPNAEPLELKPGIYPDIDYDSYSRIRAINFSILNHFRDTPAHAHWIMSHEPRQTPAFRQGYLVHLAILEPQRFDETCILRPPFRRNTKVGKLAHAQFEAKNRGREFLSQVEWDLCRGIRHSVSQHASARRFLYGQGASELTIVWEDAEFKILCKARVDRVAVEAGQSLVIDLKTVTETASLRNWQRAIANYVYPEQAAMYLDGLNVLAPTETPRRFLWLVAEKSPPYLVRLFDADYDALEWGYQMYRDHLRQYAACTKSGEWPGYPEGVETAGLPAWLQKTFDATL